MSKSKTSKDRMNAAERRVRVMAMRLSGYRQQDIADALGCAVSTVNKDLKRMLAEFTEEAEAKTEEYRAIWNARFEKMLIGIWVAATQGRVGAIDRVLKIAERSARLNGLDRPTKVAPTTPDGESPYEEPMSDEQLAAILNPIFDAARTRQDRDADSESEKDL